MTISSFPNGVAKDLRANRGKHPGANSQSAAGRWQGRICGSAAGGVAVFPAIGDCHHDVQ